MKKNPMIQSAIWLPRDLHEKLKRDGGHRGLGEEVRRRLLLSYAEEELPWYTKLWRAFRESRRITDNDPRG